MSDTDIKSRRFVRAEPGDPKPGVDFSANLDDDLIDPDEMDGYGTQAPHRRPGANDHSLAEGDAKDSQYGAAPVRDALYRDGPKGTYGQGAPRSKPKP